MTSDTTTLMLLMRSRRYEEALVECERFLKDAPHDRQVSMTAGLCHCMLRTWAGATECFLAAGVLDGDDAAALLMLAACYENLGQAETAERCVKKAIEAGCDPDEVVGGLALTQQLWCDWPKAAANYEIALKGFATRVLRQMREHNSPDTAVKCWPGRTGDVWLKYADHAWTQAASDDGLAGFVLPTKVMFADEAFGQRDCGPYWRDVRQQDGAVLRQYLPNGIHTFLYRCYDSKEYRTMIKGRAIALAELGRSEEAAPYLFESSLFQRLEITTDNAISPSDPGLYGLVMALLGGIREHASAIHISVESDAWQVLYEIDGVVRSLPDTAEFLPAKKEAGILAIERLKEHAHLTAGPTGDQAGLLDITCAGHPVSFDVVITATAAGTLARLTTRSPVKAEQHEHDADCSDGPTRTTTE